MRVNRFINSTDFASLGNDDGGTISITIPATVTIAAGSIYEQTATLTVGQAMAQQSVLMQSSLDGRWVPTNQMQASFDESQVIGAIAVVYRLSDTQFALSAMILNPNNFSITVSAGVTVTAKISSFRTPLP